jgi:protein arginine kinase activator
MTTCQLCNKNAATVHITDILVPENGAEPRPEQKHVCETCAVQMNLPFLPVGQKSMGHIWKLLQQSAQKARQESALACGDCGMTLAEFRSRGRLGCPNDYEVFRAHLDPLLRRVHNAVRHIGRVPGLDEHDLQRRQHLTELRAKLEVAIREEAYEHAARLRDEIQNLELESEPGDSGES